MSGKGPDIDETIEQYMKCKGCCLGGNFILGLVFSKADSMIDNAEVKTVGEKMESFAGNLIAANRKHDAEKVFSFLLSAAVKNRKEGRLLSANTLLASAANIARIQLDDPVKVSDVFDEAIEIIIKATAVPGGCPRMAEGALRVMTNFGYEEHHSFLARAAEEALREISKAGSIRKPGPWKSGISPEL